jgi:hypothetical protein
MRAMCCTLILLVSFPSWANRIDVPTSATESLSAWYAPTHESRALIILFPGGKGKIFDENGHPSQNFLVRSRLAFLRQGYSVAIVGAATWAPNGYSDADRVSEKHARDISVLEDTINRDQQPIILIGTSRGTISTVHFGAVSRIPLVKGLILTSSVVLNATFNQQNYSAISNPTLMLHHIDDGCPSSPFRATALFWASLNRAIFEKFISIDGGISASDDPCNARTKHGFWQTEHFAIEQMNTWISDVLSR